MSTARRTVGIAMLVALVGCSDATAPTEPLSALELVALAPSLSVVSSVPAICGTSMTVGLMLGDRLPTGEVEVSNDESNLYVVFRASRRRVLASAVFVGDSPSEIPTTRRGRPRLLAFPYRSGHPNRPTEVIWEIPLSDVSGTEAIIAAFAQVGLVPSWADGQPITPGRDWATYFTYTIANCSPGTVGSGGGTVSTPAGDASITIPAGALTDPVDITIEPATIEDLSGHESGASAIASGLAATRSTGDIDAQGLGAEAPALPAAVDPLPPINGVTPIAGTIWDFGPDGTQFNVPATVVLSYDEEDLPDGLDEAELGAFIINGIFEPLPSTVDVVANTVTAQVEHFSFVFVAGQLGQFVDLEVINLTTSPDPPSGAFSPVDITAVVGNNGPGPSGGARLVYEAQGEVLLGDLDSSCSDISASSATIAISCGVAALGAGGTESAAAFQIIPQEAGGTVIVTATVHPTANDSDADPDNDALQLAFSVPGGGGATVDLKAGLGLGPSSQPIIGGLMEIVGRVDNLGPDASSGGRWRFDARGPVVLGPLLAACTEVANPAPADVAIECDVDPLSVYGIDLKAIRLVAQSAGDVTITATVSPAVGDTDHDLTNNSVAWTTPVASTLQVDLEPFSLKVTGRAVGEPAVFVAEVYNSGPHPSDGGTMIYEASGDVTLGDVHDSCTVSPNPSVVAVFCEIDPFHGFSGEVGALTVVPQSNGVVTFTATAVTTSGATDQDPSNDQAEITVLMGTPNVTDLALTSFGLSPSSQTVVGAPMDFLVDVKNLGPDASAGGTLQFLVGGDVVLGTLAGSCTGVQQASGVTVTCDVASLAVGSTDGNGRLQVIPQSAGNVTVQAFLAPSFGAVDPDRSNDFRVLTVAVEPAG